MRFRRTQAPLLTIAPPHPAEVTWVDSTRTLRRSHSKMCGEKVLWSTTRNGGYILWEQLLSFVGDEQRKTLRTTNPAGRR